MFGVPINVQKHIFGLDNVGGSHVTGSDQGGSYTPTDLDRQVMEQERLARGRGFIEGMGGWNNPNAGRFARADHAGMPAAPPPQWSYVQGQGPVWQTPERVGSTTSYAMTNNAPGTPGFYGGGNRI